MNTSKNTRVNINSNNKLNINNNLSRNVGNNIKNLNNSNVRKLNNVNKNTSIMEKINNMMEEKKGNNYIFVIVGVLSLVVVLGGVYYYYYHVRGKTSFVLDKKEILTDEHDGQTELEIASGDIPLSKYSNEYAISMWLKVNDYKYKYGEEKVILRRGEKHKGSPEILLDAKDNKLIVRTQLQHQTNQSLKKLNTSESFADIPVTQDNDDNEKFTAYGSSSTHSELAPFSIDNNNNENNVTTEVKPIEELISNNAAPVESKQYVENFFNMVSGNSVMETFQDDVETDIESQLTTNMTNFAITVCNMFDTIKSKELAEELFQKIDSSFKILIEVIELSKNLDDEEQIKSMMDEKMNQLSTLKAEDKEISKITDHLIKIQELSMKLQASNQSFNLINLKKSVNEKMKLMNCNFKLTGSTPKVLEANITVSVLELLRSSMFILIHNLGQQIKKEYPELIRMAEAPIDNEDQCILVNLPLQKWTNIVISQYNQVIDIYLDGKLVSSCVLKGFPLVQEETAYLCPEGGFDGMLSRLSFYNTAVTQDMAHNIYKDGAVYQTNLFNIPTYVYVIVALLIVGLIVYSLMV